MWTKNAERCYARWLLMDHAYSLKPTARERSRLFIKQRPQHVYIKKRPAESEPFVSTSSCLIQSLAANPLPRPFDSALPLIIESAAHTQRNTNADAELCCGDSRERNKSAAPAIGDNSPKTTICPAFASCCGATSLSFEDRGTPSAAIPRR
jgi:hypothetical protein